MKGKEPTARHTLTRIPSPGQKPCRLQYLLQKEPVLGNNGAELGINVFGRFIQLQQTNSHESKGHLSKIR